MAGSYLDSLTPAQIQAILSYMQSGPGSAYGAQNIGGMTYGKTGVENTNEGGSSFNVNGFGGYDPNAMKPGDSYMQYGTNGGQVGLGTLLDGGRTKASDFKDFGQMVMTLAPMALGGAIAGGAFGGAGAAAGGAGAMGPITAAEAAAGDAAFASQFAPYLSGAAGAAGGAAGSSFDGGGGFGAAGGDAPEAMGPLTASQSAASDAQLAAQLAPYSTGLSAGAAAGAGGASGGLFGFSPMQLMGYGQLASGLLGAGATLSASKTAAAAANRATDFQQGMFNTINGQLAPYRAAGASAAGTLSSMLNTGPGGLLHPFGTADFQLDPGIKFATEQGNQALQNSQAAKNGVLSGAALKDLIGYNSGMAAQGYQSAYDRYMGNKAANFNMLQGTASLGENAAANTGSVGANISNGISNTIVGAGQANAAGMTGAANALGSGINGYGNSYLLSQMLKNYSTSPSSTSTGSST